MTPQKAIRARASIHSALSPGELSLRFEASQVEAAHGREFVRRADAILQTLAGQGSMPPHALLARRQKLIRGRPSPWARSWRHPRPWWRSVRRITATAWCTWDRPAPG